MSKVDPAIGALNTLVKAVSRNDSCCHAPIMFGHVDVNDPIVLLNAEQEHLLFVRVRPMILRLRQVIYVLGGPTKARLPNLQGIGDQPALYFVFRWEECPNCHMLFLCRPVDASGPFG